MSTETVDATESDVECLPVEIQRDSINASAKELGVSSLKVSKLGVKEKVSYGKRKLSQQLTKATTEKVVNSLEVPESKLSELQQSHGECHKCKDMDVLVADVKPRVSISSRKEKIKLLTLAPLSWSVQRCVS